MTNQDVGGLVCHENGFLSGITVLSFQQLSPNTAYAFRVYRDGVATTCLYIITDGDNVTNPNGNPGGCVRARKFNINPMSVSRYDSDYQVYQFKAGEKITVRVEAVNLPGYTDSSDSLQGQLILWLNFDIITPEALSSQGLGGGQPGGGGGGDDEEIVV